MPWGAAGQVTGIPHEVQTLVGKTNPDINSWKLTSTQCPVGFLQQPLCIFIETHNMKHSVIWGRKWASTPCGCCPKRRVYQSGASNRLYDSSLDFTNTVEPPGVSEAHTTQTQNKHRSHVFFFLEQVKRLRLLGLIWGFEDFICRLLLTTHLELNTESG